MSESTSGAGLEQTDRPSKMSVCNCGEPLVMCFHVAYNEWVCMGCGSHFPMFGNWSQTTTDALWDRFEALRAEHRSSGDPS